MLTAPPERPAMAAIRKAEHVELLRVFRRTKGSPRDSPRHQKPKKPSARSGAEGRTCNGKRHTAPAHLSRGYIAICGLQRDNAGRNPPHTRAPHQYRVGPAGSTHERLCHDMYSDLRLCPTFQLFAAGVSSCSLPVALIVAMLVGAGSAVDPVHLESLFLLDCSGAATFAPAHPLLHTGIRSGVFHKYVECFAWVACPVARHTPRAGLLCTAQYVIVLTSVCSLVDIMVMETATTLRCSELPHFPETRSVAAIVATLARCYHSC